jgi:hypothetical protein
MAPVRACTRQAAMQEPSLTRCSSAWDALFIRGHGVQTAERRSECQFAMACVCMSMCNMQACTRCYMCLALLKSERVGGPPLGSSTRFQSPEGWCWCWCWCRCQQLLLAVSQTMCFLRESLQVLSQSPSPSLLLSLSPPLPARLLLLRYTRS